MPCDVMRPTLKACAPSALIRRGMTFVFEEDTGIAHAWRVGRWLAVLLDGLEIYPQSVLPAVRRSGPRSRSRRDYLRTRAHRLLPAKTLTASTILQWTGKRLYGEVRLAEEEQLSAYSFDHADIGATRQMFELNEKGSQASARSLSAGRPGRQSGAFLSWRPMSFFA